MRFALNRIVFFFVWACFLALGANSQEKPASELSLPRFSTATITQSPFANHSGTHSRLISLSDIAIADADRDNAGYQLIIKTNTQSYQGYLGPQLPPNSGYNANNPGYRSFTGSVVRLKDLTPSTYTLSFQQDGYQDLNLVISIVAGRQSILNIELVPKSGFLSISGDQAIQVVEIDDVSVGTIFPLELSEGRHKVRVRSFAYEDYLQSLMINADQLTSLDIKFQAAWFRLSAVSWSRQRFRPANIGALGSSTLSFDVSSLGKAQVKISDDQGNIIRSQALANFTAWRQQFIWDGRDTAGNLVPEGSYSWQIDAQPETGVPGQAVKSQGIITIDYASFIKYRSLWSGPAGLDFVSDTYNLSAGALQIGSRLAYLSAAAPSGGLNRFLMNLGVRYGLIPNLELWVNAAANIEMAQAASHNSLIGGGIAWAAIQLPGLRPDREPSLDFGLKLNLSGAGMLYPTIHYPADLDEAGILPGARLGLAGQARIGVFSLLLEPVLHVSTMGVRLETSQMPADGQSPPAEKFSLYASFHGGFYFDFDWLMLGLSAALYTTPAFTIQWPVRLGIQAQLMPVESFVIGLDFQLKPDTGAGLSPSFGLNIGYIQ